MTNVIILIIYFGIGLLTGVGSYKKANHVGYINIISNIITSILIIFIWPILIIAALIIFSICNKE